MCALTRTWPILRGYLRLGTLDHLAQWRHGLYLHKIFFSLLPFNCFGIGVHVQLLYHCTYNHFLLADQDYLALWNIPVAGAILRYVSQHNGTEEFITTRGYTCRDSRQPLLLPISLSGYHPSGL